MVVKWPSARGTVGTGGFVCKSCTCSTAYFSSTNNFLKCVGSILVGFLFTGAAARLHFGTKWCNTTHRPRKHRSFICLLVSFTFLMVNAVVLAVSNSPGEKTCPVLSTFQQAMKTFHLNCYGTEP